MEPAVVLAVRGLSKSYGSRALFEALDLVIRERERVGLVGVNGTGKSTLLRVLAGIEPADGGVLERKRESRTVYLSQNPELDPELTAIEHVEQGLQLWKDACTAYEAVSQAIGEGDTAEARLEEQGELLHRIEALGGWNRGTEALSFLTKLGMKDHADRKTGPMSGGELRRVALAQALVSRPDFLVLDEPTNHLDAETIEWLESYLGNEFQGALLVVTHDRYVLDRATNRTLELSAGRLHSYDGGYSTYLEKKAERLALEERSEEKRQNLLRREREWLLRGAQARTTKQKARIDRAKGLIAEAGPEREEKIAFAARASRLGKTILELENVAVGVAGRTLLTEVSLLAKAGERFGILGPNGAGKTTLLHTIIGDREPLSGKIVRGKNTAIARIDQARMLLQDDWCVFDNVAERQGAITTGAGTVTYGDEELSMHSFLERFLFDGSAQRRKVSSLSGGERARVALAMVLKKDSNLLLLDEPTNDLDVIVLAALEEMLAVFPGVVFAVSHDRAFLDKIATSILAVEDGKLARYEGGYSDYAAKRAEDSELGRGKPQASTPSVRPAASPSKAPEPAKAAKSPLTYKERLELEGIWDAIGVVEARVAETEKALADPALYTTKSAEVAPLEAALAKAKAEVVRLTSRWEELEAKKGAG